MTVLPQFEWDEPEGCTTPRGWLGLLNHPDEEQLARMDGSRCVGNYLEYPQSSVSYQLAGNIHACAYAFRWDHTTLAQSNIRLGSKWCPTIQEAKAWVEEQVREYLGRL